MGTLVNFRQLFCIFYIPGTNTHVYKNRQPRVSHSGLQYTSNVTGIFWKYLLHGK